MMVCTAIALIIMSTLLACDSCASINVATYVRPILITQALADNKTVYYLGVGSNLLKEKVITRGASGISVKSFEPARVENHRLAFNMRGFLPLEPSMGGIEECEGSSCHGALMEMTAAEYQKLWLSEGGGAPKPGYEEIIVDAYPYSSKVSVKAIALRVTKQSMLQHDVAPSARYLDIIIKGAEELKLEPFYIANLKSIPRARVPKILEILARKNVFFTGFLFRRKLIPVVRAISKICWFFYYSVPVSAAFVDSPKNVPSNVGNVLVDEIGSGRVAMIPSGGSSRIGEGIMHSVRTLLSNLALAAIILPGAITGTIIEIVYRVFFKTAPPGLFGQKPPVKIPAVTADQTVPLPGRAAPASI